jgi:hypothetical protein
VGIYHLGQSVKLSVAFTDAAGAAANPTTVRCLVIAPDGTETTYTTPTITNPSTGTYQLVLAPAQHGAWRYRWEGDTPAASSYPRDEGEFHILGSAF